MSTMTTTDTPAQATSAAPAGPEKITLRICDSEQTGAITDYAALHGVARTSAAAALFALGVQTWLASASSAACQRVAGIRAQDVTPSASHALAGRQPLASGSVGALQPSAIAKLPLEKVTLTVRDPGLLASLDAYAKAHGFRARTTAAAALFALGVETWRGTVATEVVSHHASSAVAAPRLPEASDIAKTEPDCAARDLQLLLDHSRSPQILADALQHAFIYRGASADPCDAQEAADFIVSCDDGDEQSPAFERCLDVLIQTIGMANTDADRSLLLRVFLVRKRALRGACKSNARAIARQFAHRLLTQEAIRAAFFSAPVSFHGRELSADYDGGIEAMADGEISWEALAAEVRECIREGIS